MAGYFTREKLGKGILWLLVIVWMALIFGFSARTAPESSAQSGRVIRVAAELAVPEFKAMSPPEQEGLIEEWQHVVRKSAHGLAYFGLGILSSLALSGYGWSRRKQIWTALAIPYVYSVLDEIHQIFVSGRAFMFTDIGIDMAAASAGVLITFLIITWGQAPSYCG